MRERFEETEGHTLSSDPEKSELSGFPTQSSAMKAHERLAARALHKRERILLSVLLVAWVRVSHLINHSIEWCHLAVDLRIITDISSQVR